MFSSRRSSCVPDSIVLGRVRRVGYGQRVGELLHRLRHRDGLVGTHRIGPVIETADGEVCREAERERDTEGDECVPAPVGEVKIALQLIERSLGLGYVRQEALAEVAQKRLRVDGGGKRHAAGALSGHNGNVPLTQEGTHLVGRREARRSSLGRGKFGDQCPSMLATVADDGMTLHADRPRGGKPPARDGPRRCRALHRGDELGLVEGKQLAARASPPELERPIDLQIGQDAGLHQLARPRPDEREERALIRAALGAEEILPALLDDLHQDGQAEESPGQAQNGCKERRTDDHG